MKKLATKLFTLITELRNFLYDSGFADSIHIQVPVISVGNLTVGGTGKTPFVDLLIEYLESKNKKVGLVSRNYKAIVKKTTQVDLQNPMGASYFGDEAWWLAEKHPQTKVVVGPYKWFSAFNLVSKNKLEIIIVDDGFQHRALHRDLDIVIVDCTAEFSEYELVPTGLGREPFSSLNRADIILLSKINLIDQDQLEKIKALLPENKLTISSKSNLEFELNDAKKTFAFAGIAKPKIFKQQLLKIKNLDLIDFKTYPDHFSYSQSDISEIENLAKDCDLILTTEKDFVKIKDFKCKKTIQAVILKTEITQGTSDLHAKLDSLFF